jgi:hypothetical protein
MTTRYPGKPQTHPGHPRVVAGSKRPHVRRLPGKPAIPPKPQRPVPMPADNYPVGPAGGDMAWSEVGW